jgi:hypothetical protein
MKRVLLVLLAAGVTVGAIVLVNQVRGGLPTRPAAPPSPLTDVAARPRAAPVTPDERPERRRAPLPPSTQPTAPPLKAVPPALMPDPAHPPQGTRPRALPGPPRPPDPFVPPPIAQDPDRGRREPGP